MGISHRSRFCRVCQAQRLHTRHSFSGGMGCLLTIVTLGLFLPVWAIIAVRDGLEPYRCQQCGTGKRFLF